MKCIREMLAIARFETMRNRHRRAWELAHGEQTALRNAFVAAVMERIVGAHPDQFASMPSKTTAH